MGKCDNCNIEFDDIGGSLAFCSLECAEYELQRLQGRNMITDREI